MPSPSVSPVTRPNSVSTPTFPVGIEVVLHNSRSTTRITTPHRKILGPAPRKLGISGIDPRELSAISASVATPLPRCVPTENEVRRAYSHFLLRREHAAIFDTCPGVSANYFLEREVRRGPSAGRSPGKNEVFHTPQGDPYILWHFLLTPQVARATIRANVVFFGRKAFAGRLPTARIATGGMKICSICPVSPSNASMRNAIYAATGCVPTLPARSSMTAAVPAAVTCCATCRRLSAPASACARAR